MKKPLVKYWKEQIEATKTPNGFIISKGFSWRAISSEHGKSRARAWCPCCGFSTEVYVWSFSGCGKRCSVCEVLLGTQGAHVSNEDLKGIDFTYENGFLITKGKKWKS